VIKTEGDVFLDVFENEIDGVRGIADLMTLTANSEYENDYYFLHIFLINALRSVTTDSSMLLGFTNLDYVKYV
jgi:hypothetical protein